MVLLSMCLGAILCVGLGIAGYARYLTVASSQIWGSRWLFGSGHWLDIGDRSSLLINNRLLFSTYEADRPYITPLPPLPAPYVDDFSPRRASFKAPAWAWQRPHPLVDYEVWRVDNLAVGLPLRCFVGTLERRHSSDPAKVIRRGYHISAGLIAEVDNHAAPTHILPGSLVVNWLFWTSIVLAGLKLPWAYRTAWAAHRRRSGRCVCGTIFWA